jgi:hypothetical protein
VKKRCGIFKNRSSAYFATANLVFITLVSSWELQAQQTLQAITFASFGALAYSPTNGVGWSFVPQSDLLVTAISSSMPQVNFWHGADTLVATFNYAGPYSGPGSPSTNFQAIQPLQLSAGQLYYISTQAPNFASNTLFYAFGRSGTDLTPFTNSPSLGQVASYYLSPSGEWSSTTTPPSENANAILLGPNFEFQVIPEPACTRLILLAIASAFGPGVTAQRLRQEFLQRLRFCSSSH